MKLRNEIFAHVYDWLRKNKKVKDQQDLANKTGIHKNTITNILNGETNVSDRTLLKLNEGFGYIFNMQYLRGSDPYHMFVDNLLEDIADGMAPYISHQQKVIEEEKEEKQLDTLPTKPKDTQLLVKGLENLLQIVSQQIKENEELRRELQSSIREVKQIANNLLHIHIPKKYTDEQPEYYASAEPDDTILSNQI